MVADPKTVSQNRPMLHVKVISPYQTYLDDDAFSISAVNTAGPFDILPQHHNFITLLQPCVMAINLPSGVQYIKITRGIMHVRADHAVVYLNI